MAHGNVCCRARSQTPCARSLRRRSPPAARTTWRWATGTPSPHYSQAGVAAFYSGAPEPTSLDACGSGCVASVTLSDQGVECGAGAGRRHRDPATLPGRRRAFRREIIGSLIQGHARPSLMLDVTLRGMAAADQVIDAERIASEAAGGFYWLRVTNQSHLELAALDPAELPGDARHRPVRAPAHRNGWRAPPPSRSAARAERALQLGVALLRGKEALP